MKYIIAIIILILSLTVSYSDNIVRYGQNVSAYNPTNPVTYTSVTNATWGELNQAISNSLNSSARGFVYVSGDVTGNGASTGPIRIIGSGDKGFDFKGSFNTTFTEQIYSMMSVLNANANSASRSRVLVIATTNVWVDGFVIEGGYTSGGDEPFLNFAQNGCGGAGIAAQASGLRLSHLDIRLNTTSANWKKGGGIYSMHVVQIQL